MGVSINTRHSKALMYSLPMILPPRNNIQTIPVSLAAEGDNTMAIKVSGGQGIGRDLSSREWSVSSTLPADNFSPRDSTAVS